MLDVSRDEITGGSIPRVLLVLAAPLVVQNVALVTQEVVDLFWVGRLGGDAVAAVGLAAVVGGVAMVPVIAVTRGTQIVTARRAGADRDEAALLVPFNGAALGVLVAVAVGAVLVASARPVVNAYLSDPAVVGYAVDYLVAYPFVLAATAASDSLEYGFTGWGDTRAALYVNLTAIVVNVAFDPLLVFGVGPFPRWETFGAAAATAVGYGTGALFALALGWRGRRGFVLTRRSLALDPATMRAVVDVATPMAGQDAARHGARLLLVSVVSVLGGPAGLAAYHVGSRVATVAFVPAQGIGQASTSMVGQNLGAERPARARRTTWVGAAVAVAGLSAFALVQWVFPTAIAHVFVPDLSGQALTFTVLYLQILAYGYWALGAVFSIEAGFNGASRTRVSMVSTMLQYWAVRVPVAVVGGFALGLSEPVVAVFWGVTLSNVAAALWLAGYYHYSTTTGMNRRAAEEAAGAPGG